MQTRNLTAVSILLLFLLPALFSACVKSKSCEELVHYTYFTPIYKSKQEVRENIGSHAPRAILTTGKIYIRGNYIFLNEPMRGIHVIDNSNPSQPNNVSFIDIPGNVDLAVKGNILYADQFNDLLAIDISNPLDVKVEKIVDAVLQSPYGVWMNNGVEMVPADWIRHDTTFLSSCDREILIGFGGVTNDVNFSNAVSAPSGSAGIGGSMARFTLVNDRLYTVGLSNLNVFNITAPVSPSFVKKVNIVWGIETIYPFKDKLFVGSNRGMYMFDINNPDEPVLISQFEHAVSCDPVIADDQYAYVTLRSGNACAGTSDQLDVIDISNINAPSLLKSYQMTNPHGLSKDGNLLFICDGKAGVRVMDASNPATIFQRTKIDIPNAYDIILNQKRALIVGGDGIYQYDYTNPFFIRMLSKINTGKP